MTATVLVVANYSALTGKASGITNQLPWLLVVAALAGLAYGFWLRSARPDVYAGIGREAVTDDRVPEAAPVGPESAVFPADAQSTAAITR